jgi:hypothetical protein
MKAIINWNTAIINATGINNIIVGMLLVRLKSKLTSV